MLHSVKEMRGDVIVARDGEVGAVGDLYFDDERWGVRYLAVETNGWLAGRQILIPPSSIDRSRSSEQTICVTVSRDELRRSPELGGGEVSRSHEMALARYYGFPYYWIGPELWGPAPRPVNAEAARDAGRSAAIEMQEHAESSEAGPAPSRLRSAADVVGYRLEATDGAAGHVEDVLFDDDTWSVAHLVIDTRDWLPGRKVLLSPGLVEAVDPTHRTVRVRAARREIEQAPEALGR
ncbi:MAG TPA: PRC-barrel domain-containing protein [Burkholderiales bacterium]|nr:PRC-barrel domain-containing protein [Burkholderiales bacterium]